MLHKKDVALDFFWNFFGLIYVIDSEIFGVPGHPVPGCGSPLASSPKYDYVSRVYFVSAMLSHKISCTSYVFRLGRLSSLQCFWGVLGSVWCAKMRTKQEELKTWSECFIGDHEMRTTSEALLVTCTPLQHTVLARQREPTPKIF